MAAPASPRKTIDFDSLIVAYAMSRLDRRFLDAFAYGSWAMAFRSVGSALDVKPTSVKNLRQEFDPYFDNARRGWQYRPMRPARKQVMDLFGELGDQQLIEFVRGLIARDESVAAQVVEPLQQVRTQVFNVAQRLLTGRLAEEYFVQKSELICGIDPAELVDRRSHACGFDFSVSSRPALMIEVKGITGKAGEIACTDLEYRTAREHGEHYWLIVVGNLPARPVGKLHLDPCRSLTFRQVTDQTPRTTWRAGVRVA